MTSRLDVLPKGMAPAAFNAAKCAAEMAGIDLLEHPRLRFTQTLGYAAASSGFHARDGFVTVNGKTVAYCAAFDGSVLWLTIAEIKAWVAALAWWGFAAWYRPWTTNGKPNYHIHAVYAGLPKKAQLVAQLMDYVNDRNGLAGHGRETFYTGNKEQDAYILRLHRWAQEGGPHPGLPPKAPGPAKAPDFQIRTKYDIRLSGRELSFDAPAIDGTAYIPARPWFEQALGITTMPDGSQAVKWAPEEEAIYVQGRKVMAADGTRSAPVRLLQVGGVKTGYMRALDLVEFSQLSLQADHLNRILRISKPRTLGAP